MAEQKIFAGPRIRRIRNQLGLTQTAMAEELEISPSYLNLIERNQRPLTVQLLLKLATTYKLDLDELRGEGPGSHAALKEVFSDALLAGELPGDQELVEIAEAAPNAAAGILKLYKAYRESQNRLSDLKDLLAREGHETSLVAARLPADEVREILEARPNYYPAIDEKAEAFAGQLGQGTELLGSLKEWMRSEHHIAVRSLPVHAMPNWRRRFDRHSMRLFLSERLSPYDQVRELAMEACQLHMADELLAQIEALNLSSDEARRIARFELAQPGHQIIILIKTRHDIQSQVLFTR